MRPSASLPSLGHPGASGQSHQFDVRGGAQVHESRVPLGRVESKERHFAPPGTEPRIATPVNLRSSSTSVGTRRADADVSFAATFANAADLTRAVEGVTGSSVPLWHLAFLNPAMAHARALGEDHLLFGAYPREREEEVSGPLRAAVEAGSGRVLGAAEAYRAWGQRFFPVTPSASPSTPIDIRSQRMAVSEIPEAMADTSPAANASIQGTVARSGELLLLMLEGGTQDPALIDA